MKYAEYSSKTRSLDINDDIRSPRFRTQQLSTRLTTRIVGLWAWLILDGRSIYQYRYLIDSFFVADWVLFAIAMTSFSVSSKLLYVEAGYNLTGMGDPL